MNSKQAGFTVTFIRHGETHQNKCGILQGQSVAASLNENGKVQAKSLGRYLSADVFSHVYSSDLLRAKETVEIVMSENKAYNDKSQLSFSAKEIKLDSRLQEKSFGVLEGKKKTCLASFAKSAGKSLKHYVPEGGETSEELEERATAFFQALCDECYAYAVRSQDHKNNSKPHANVLVLSHGRFILTLFLSFSKKYGCHFPPGKLSASLSNTSRSCFNIRFHKKYSLTEYGSRTMQQNEQNSASKDVDMICTLLNDCSHYQE